MTPCVTKLQATQRIRRNTALILQNSDTVSLLYQSEIPSKEKHLNAHQQMQLNQAFQCHT